MDQDVEVVSVTRAEQLLGVNRTTIYRWLKEGFVVGEQLTPEGPWHLRIDAKLRARPAPAVPEGWVGLAEASRRLRVSRQTVLQKVHFGRLEAVLVNNGRRRGLRINVNGAPVGLFATEE